ncbi:hypothetical protein CK203_065752 [Vitis vinifera]|uniref:Uncharacterized protein n=1 Tax=Vitis vinifera TaxID=29760 RepID=A0A438G3E8_VITVI|nr:hypothetical protein CK203_065752 [Vitis vinifera]
MAAMPDSGASGYPSDPQLERKRICREVFTLDKWNNMTAYRVEQLGQPQPAAIPAARRASPRHIPEAERGWPFPFLSIERYAAHCRSSLASQSILTQQITALSAHQEQIIATQTQRTAILRQIQHHLGIISPPEHSFLSHQSHHRPPPCVHQTMPPEEPTTGKAEAAEPSSPHHPPATI